MDLLVWVSYGVTFVFGLAIETHYAIAECGKNPKTWRQVKKCLVEAESETLPALGKDQARRIRSILSHRIVVATSDDRLTYFVGHPDDQRGIDWKNEPFNVDIRICDGRLIKHHKFNRMVEFADLRRGSPIPDPIRRDILFFFLPIWPLQGYPAPHADDSGMIFVLGAAVESEDYEVTSERQLINEEWCRLVRSKSDDDRIWISEDKDLCVLRRQWYAGPSKALMGELLAKDVREVAPGLWMPVEVEMTYCSTNGESTSLTPVARTVTRVLRCDVDEDVPMETLELTLKPGTIERISAQEINQLSPGGSEHLLEVANFYRDRIGLPQRPAVSSWFAATGLEVLVGALGGYIVGIIVLRWCCTRQFRSSRKLRW